MEAKTITNELHKAADEKLRKYCKERFGDLFKLCGEHNAKSIITKDHAFMRSNAVAKGLDSLWHGSLWVLAEETLFIMLRDEWRSIEVQDFMKEVESLKERIEHIDLA